MYETLHFYNVLCMCSECEHAHASCASRLLFILEKHLQCEKLLGLPQGKPLKSVETRNSASA